MDKRLFNFSIAILLDGARAVTAAATAHPELGPRLKTGLQPGTILLIEQVSGALASQKDKETGVGGLTDAQTAALVVMKDKVAAARKAARVAFKGQTVMLHEDFQVGGSTREPNGLPDILKRAKIVLASCQIVANAAALADVGWLAADTTELDAAITTVGGAEITQNTAQSAPVDATTDLTTKANSLYTNTLVIQNAADLQWPARDPANKGVRKEFQLDTFPPRTNLTAPPAPANLTVKPGAAGSKKFALTWDGNTHASEYEASAVIKSTGVVAAKVTATKHGAAIVLPAVAAGTEIEFTVIAKNSEGDSDPSAPVTGTVP